MKRIYKLLLGLAFSVNLTASVVAAQALPVTSLSPPVASQSQPIADQTPSYLKDRGTGIATSIFGTYVGHRELIILFPCYEYYHDRNFEYKPEEFGVVGSTDFRGRYRANEGLLFLAYGINDRMAFEFEAATIKASLEKSPADTSALPPKIVESGLGDVEAQLRWRWRKESEHRPEVFSYAEVVIPHHKSKHLIGTSGVELSFGTGVIRGFNWGTMTFRAAIGYSAGSTSKFDLGEYAVEYLKRLSPKWRLYVGVEGKQDELSLVPELQWHISRNVFFKFNSGVGLTSRATDWAPEVGIVFTLPTKR